MIVEIGAYMWDIREDKTKKKKVWDLNLGHMGMIHRTTTWNIRVTVMKYSKKRL